MSATTEPAAESDVWDQAAPLELAAETETLVIEVDGFEGPLDLLLALARTQRVDLAKVSILGLVDQYLTFIADTKTLRMELAADYLVMAAWLAYLKSRLLLPRVSADAETASAEELAQKLTFRLMRLEAMRTAAAQIMTRKQLGIDIFARGQPEGVRTIRDTQHTAQVYDLLKAYADQRRRTIKVTHVVKARKVWSIKDARLRLEQLMGVQSGAWLQLDLFLERYLPADQAVQSDLDAKTVLASSFGATLELARDGLITLRQDQPFGPIYMRDRAEGTAWHVVS